MFDLDPDEELELVRETARKFAGDHLAPHMREAEGSRMIAKEVVAAYREIGLSGLELPEAVGGAGLGAQARVLVNEELAAGDVGAAIALDPWGTALYPLLETGVDLAALPGFSADATGRWVLASSLEGAVEIRPESVAVRLPWIAADQADGIVAHDGERVAFVQEGFEITPLRGSGLRAAGAGELTIGAASPSLVVEDAAGTSRAIARARLYQASLMLGVMRASCEFSCAYAQEREAFGRPIGHHQALAFLITDMRIALDSARLLVHEAAWRVDNNLPAEAVAASAFAQCIDAARSIGPNGVQILGGHGFMADYPVEKAMRELRALGLTLGGFDAAIEEAGQALCGTPTPLGLGTAEAL